VAPGFEEGDVVAVTRILRQRGYSVVLVGLRAGPIRGCYGLAIDTDRTLSEAEPEPPLAVILPGGVQAARQLNGDPRVHSLLHKVIEHHGYVVALDTGNSVLRAAGILKNEEASPVEDLGPSSPKWLEERLIVDGQIIRAWDAQAATECAVVLVLRLDRGT